MTLKSTVFISCIEDDLKNANRIYEDLKKNGLTSWLEEKNLLPGQKRENEIRKVIKEQSSYFLA